MLNILFMKIIYVCLLAVACAPRTDPLEKIRQENVALVERYIKAVQSRDANAMTEFLSDDYKGYGPSVADSTNKKMAIENWKYLTENLYESIDYTRSVNLAAELKDGPHPGNYVSNWCHLVIKFKDGRGPVSLNVNAVYRIENGKITLSRTFYNEADVLRQLGYEFTLVSR